MNLQNLYRATTKDDKCCHKTFRNIQAKNTEKQVAEKKVFKKQPPAQ